MKSLLLHALLMLASALNAVAEPPQQSTFFLFPPDQVAEFAKAALNPRQAEFSQAKAIRTEWVTQMRGAETTQIAVGQYLGYQNDRLVYLFGPIADSTSEANMEAGLQLLQGAKRRLLALHPANFGLVRVGRLHVWQQIENAPRELSGPLFAEEERRAAVLADTATEVPDGRKADIRTTLQQRYLKTAPNLPRPLLFGQVAVPQAELDKLALQVAHELAAVGETQTLNPTEWSDATDRLKSATAKYLKKYSKGDEQMQQIATNSAGDSLGECPKSSKADQDSRFTVAGTWILWGVAGDTKSNPVAFQTGIVSKEALENLKSSDSEILKSGAKDLKEIANTDKDTSPEIEKLGMDTAVAWAMARKLAGEQAKPLAAPTKPSATSNPSAGSNPSATPNPSAGTNPSATPNPSAGSNPSATPNPSAGTNPSATPNPSAGSNPSATPNPSAGTNPSATPNPSAGTNPSATPNPSAGTNPSATPNPSAGTNPSATPNPSAGTNPSATSNPSNSTNPSGTPGNEPGKEGGKPGGGGSGGSGPFAFDMPLLELIAKALCSACGVDPSQLVMLLQVVNIIAPELFEQLGKALENLDNAIEKGDLKDVMSKLNEIYDKVAVFQNALNSVREKGLEYVVKEAAEKQLDKFTDKGIEKLAKELNIPVDKIEDFKKIYRATQNWPTDLTTEVLTQKLESTVQSAVRDRCVNEATDLVKHLTNGKVQLSQEDLEKLKNGNLSPQAIGDAVKAAGVKFVEAQTHIAPTTIDTLLNPETTPEKMKETMRKETLKQIATESATAKELANTLVDWSNTVTNGKLEEKQKELTDLAQKWAFKQAADRTHLSVEKLQALEKTDWNAVASNSVHDLQTYSQLVSEEARNQAAKLNVALGNMSAEAFAGEVEKKAREEAEKAAAPILQNLRTIVSAVKDPASVDQLTANFKDLPNAGQAAKFLQEALRDADKAEWIAQALPAIKSAGQIPQELAQLPTPASATAIGAWLEAQFPSRGLNEAATQQKQRWLSAVKQLGIPEALVKAHLDGNLDAWKNERDNLTATAYVAILRGRAAAFALASDASQEIQKRLQEEALSQFSPSVKALAALPAIAALQAKLATGQYEDAAKFASEYFNLPQTQARFSRRGFVQTLKAEQLLLSDFSESDLTDLRGRLQEGFKAVAAQMLARTVPGSGLNENDMLDLFKPDSAPAAAEKLAGQIATAAQASDKLSDAQKAMIQAGMNLRTVTADKVVDEMKKTLGGEVDRFKQAAYRPRDYVVDVAQGMLERKGKDSKADEGTATGRSTTYATVQVQAQQKAMEAARGADGKQVAAELVATIARGEKLQGATVNVDAVRYLLQDEDLTKKVAGAIKNAPNDIAQLQEQLGKFANVTTLTKEDLSAKASVLGSLDSMEKMGGKPVSQKSKDKIAALLAGLEMKAAAVTSDRTDLQAKVTESKTIVQQIRAAKANDPRLYFLETQEQILDGMISSDFLKTHPTDLNWAKRVTARFMTSLNQALTGHIARKSASAAENDAQWRKVLSGELGGFWWGAAFADCEKIERDFPPTPLPDPQVDERYAVALMKGHIEFDLRMALLTEGIGSDGAFDEVGRLVKAAWDKKSRYPRSMIEIGMQVDPLLKSLDPIKRRARMRDQVKAYLSSHGIIDPNKGTQFKGTPEPAAFAGAGLP